MTKTIERRASLGFRAAVIALVIAVGTVAPVSAAAASAGPQDITIYHCVNENTQSDTWSANGAVNDAGTVTVLDKLIPGVSPHTRNPIIIPTIEFDGAYGSFVMTNTIRYLSLTAPDQVYPFVGTWRITGGAGAYAGIQGQGQNTGTNDLNTGMFCTTYTGQVQLVGR
jgi:hypothetical protein